MIVITGSDGIVGRVLCKTLRDKSIPFLPITHRPKEHTLPNALVLDLSAAIKPLERYYNKIKTIIHLAAAVPHSVDYPDNEYWAGKTKEIDSNILELQAKTNSNVIYMSSCGLYDRKSHGVKNELSPIKITSPYFSAKAIGEERFGSAGKTTILRLSAPIGMGLKPNLVLSKFIKSAMNNEPIMIWGSGQREQNYIDCADVGELIVRILQNPTYDILNVASELPITMLNLAKLVINAIGNGSIEISSVSDPCEGETARYSISKAKRLYKWSPNISLKQAIQNIKNEKFEKNT